MSQADEFIEMGPKPGSQESDDERAIRVVNEFSARQTVPTALRLSEHEGRNLRDFITDIETGRFGPVHAVSELSVFREKEYAVVLGSSPFAEYGYPWVIEALRIADVFSMPTALQAYADAGHADPDYVVVADPHPGLAELVDDAVVDPRTPIILPTFAPRVWRTGRLRESLYYYQPTHQSTSGSGMANVPYNQLLKWLIPEVGPYLMQSGNVTNTAVLASKLLGYKAVILVGCDNAFADARAGRYCTRVRCSGRETVEAISDGIIRVDGKPTQLNQATYAYNLLALIFYADDLHVGQFGGNGLLSGRLKTFGYADAPADAFEALVEEKLTPEGNYARIAEYARAMEAALIEYAKDHPLEEGQQE